MHLRKLVLACGFASFALSNYASALGLGEVKLKSALNQPLSAEIQLLDTRDLSADQILVSLASAADFERNGVDRVFFYTEFQFQVVMNNPGGPIVRITTRNPVREPYLNFLVEARWSSGRLLREYTVLMDLPTFDKAVPSAVEAPAVTAPKPVAKSQPSTPVSTQVQQEAPAASAPANAATEEEKPAIIAEQDQQPAKKSKISAGTYGPITSKDTLWDIAMSVRPDSSVSVHQTMLALQRLNPDAFIHGNINLIKKGQVLRIPDTTEISSVSKSDALAQVNVQNEQWSSGVSSSSTSLGAPLEASRHSISGHRDSESVSGRVKLEAPGVASKNANGQGSGANKGSGKALESELASTLEELDKAKAEKTELSSRVHDLESQVKTMQRLVDVSNEKLRALQLNASKQTEKPAEKTAVVERSSVAKSSAPAVASAAMSSVATSSLNSSISVSSAAASSAPKKAVKPVVAAPAEKSLVDQLKDNILWIGLGAAGLLGGAGIALSRRRKAQAEAAASDELFTPEPDFSAFSEEAQAEQAAHEEPLDEMSLFEEEEPSGEAETGDVVGEAEIYIAYGKFDQAEDMLLKGLAKDPSSNDIRMKLLEVYSHTHNLAEFDKHYEALLPGATSFERNRAAELRAGIPSAGEFGAAAVAGVAGAAALAAAAEEFAPLFDEDLTLDDHPAEAPVSPASEDDFNFDFDLDDEVHPDEDVQVTSKYDMDLSAEPEAAADNADDDFSLDLDWQEEAPEAPSFAALTEESPQDAVAEDEFNFDFNELEASAPVAEEAKDLNADLSVDEQVGDDFDFDLDNEPVDLAALDHEMEAFDADLDMPADADMEDDTHSPVAELDMDALTEETMSELPAGELELDLADDEFLSDSELARDTETASVAEEVPEAVGELDAFNLDDELDWEGDEDEPEAGDEEYALLDGEQSEPQVEEFDLGGDDFDIESMPEDLPAEELSFDELDSTFDDDAFETAMSGEDLEPLSEDNPALMADLGEAAEESLESPSLATHEEPPVAEELEEDSLFEQALSDFSVDDLDMNDMSDMSDDDMDAELDFMAEADEVATKLDLARAYIDMGDTEGARDILSEVAQEGNEHQRQDAADLLSRIDA